ncbi:MAG TPA: glutathione S-transferase family protein, partial [Alphaproteobacteria bacterium]|nr:glutathione S-transferase family protein [Alphaproteobacteria bacterium]
MSDHYQIFGAELSPYSVKVRAYFRYKGIPHDWLPRTDENMAEFQKFAKLPLVPLVVSNHGDAWQDSTPIIEEFETMFPEPSIVPADPALAFLSALIEEYADEWANKYMFHYRWWYDADQVSAAQRLARDARPHAADVEIEAMAQMLRERMVQRLGFVGSHSTTKEQIESSFIRTLKLLEKHLTHRPFLFGGRPALADFGLAAQLYQCWTDPTPRKLFDQKA